MKFRMLFFTGAMALLAASHAGTWGYRASGTPTTQIVGASQPTNPAVATSANDGGSPDDGAPVGPVSDPERTYNQYLTGNGPGYTMRVDASQATGGSTVSGGSTVAFTFVWSPTQDGETPPSSVGVQIDRNISLYATGNGHATIRDASGILKAELYGSDPVALERSQGVETLEPLLLTAPVVTNADGTVTATVSVDTDRLAATAANGDTAWVREIVEVGLSDVEDTVASVANNGNGSSSLAATTASRSALATRGPSQPGPLLSHAAVGFVGFCVVAVAGVSRRRWSPRWATTAVSAIVLSGSASADIFDVQCEGIKLVNGQPAVSISGYVPPNSNDDYLKFSTIPDGGFGELSLNATSSITTNTNYARSYKSTTTSAVYLFKVMILSYSGSRPRTDKVAFQLQHEYCGSTFNFIPPHNPPYSIRTEAACQFKDKVYQHWIVNGQDRSAPLKHTGGDLTSWYPYGKPQTYVVTIAQRPNSTIWEGRIEVPLGDMVGLAYSECPAQSQGAGLSATGSMHMRARMRKTGQPQYY